MINPEIEDKNILFQDTNDAKAGGGGGSFKLKTIMVCGISTLPKNIITKHIYSYLTVEIEIDPVDFKIVDVSCMLVPLLVKKLLKNALSGCEVEEGLRNAIEQIEARFFSSAKRAIIAAIKDAHARYIEYKERNIG